MFRQLLIALLCVNLCLGQSAFGVLLGYMCNLNETVKKNEPINRCVQKRWNKKSEVTARSSYQSVSVRSALPRLSQRSSSQNEQDMTCCYQFEDACYSQILMKSMCTVYNPNVVKDLARALYYLAAQECGKDVKDMSQHCSQVKTTETDSQCQQTLKGYIPCTPDSDHLGKAGINYAPQCSVDLTVRSIVPARKCVANAWESTGHPKHVTECCAIYDAGTVSLAIYKKECTVGENYEKGYPWAIDKTVTMANCTLKEEDCKDLAKEKGMNIKESNIRCAKGAIDADSGHRMSLNLVLLSLILLIPILYV